MEGSVRVNLSVPREIDAVLGGLAEKTGASKASFVMQALQRQLPELRRMLVEHDEVKAYVERKYREAARGVAPEGSFPQRLPRAQRRRLEREQRKAAKSEHSGG